MSPWIAIPLHGWPAASQAEGKLGLWGGLEDSDTFFRLKFWSSWLDLRQPTSTRSVVSKLFYLTDFSLLRCSTLWGRRCTRRRRTRTAVHARWGLPPTPAIDEHLNSLILAATSCSDWNSSFDKTELGLSCLCLWILLTSQSFWRISFYFSVLWPCQTLWHEHHWQHWNGGRHHK